MGESQQSRQADFVLPPRAGLIGSYAVSNSAANANLGLLDNQTKDPTTADTLHVGPQGCYATFLADGGDVYVIFGPTQASVSGANAPVVATNGVNAAGVCWKLPANMPAPLLLTKADVWIGYIAASGTPQLRVYKSSPYPQAC